MICLDCQHLVSRGAVMTHNGFSGCKQLSDWDFRATTKERECPAFARAADDVVVTRSEWAAKK